MLTKTCTLCNKTITVENQEDFSKYFFRDKKGKYKHNARCKICCREEKIKIFKKFPEKMNPNYIYKSYLKPCIVCDSIFLAKSQKHICCSDECKKIKNKTIAKLNKEKIRIFYANKRAKDIKKATVRFKHYTKKEISMIKKALARDWEYKTIAKKLGRTTVSVGKIARKLKNGEIK